GGRGLTSDPHAAKAEEDRSDAEDSSSGGRMNPSDAGERIPKMAVTDPRRATWNGAIVEELRAMQDPGDGDIVRELLDAFRHDSVRVFAALHERAARGDLDQVFEVAHRIKGAAMNLGAERLAQAAAELE